MASLDFVPAEESYDARVASVEADIDRLVRRLRSLTSTGWRPREAPIRALAQELADLAASLEGRPSRSIPELPAYGLADAIAVLGADLVAALFENVQPAATTRARELVAGGLASTT